MLAAGVMLVLAWIAQVVVIFGVGYRGPALYDEQHFHLPTIRTFAEQLPMPDLSDYLVATSPGYHLVMAAVFDATHLGDQWLRLIGGQFAVLAVVIMAWWFGKRVAWWLAVALSAGANFIARGFSGDPNGVARLLVEAVRHPGFSFVQILSPCVTFRPEQRGWKDLVEPVAVEPTSDPAVAGKRILGDSGLAVGVLYVGSRPAYHTPAEAKASRLAKIEETFAL